MVKGWAGAVHGHPHDQIVYVVRGHLRVNCLGRTFEVWTGDSQVIDVFTPCREDYIT